MTNIKQVSFGFPINKTIRTTLDDLDKIKNQNFTGFNVKVVISIDKENKKNFNQFLAEKDFLEKTNAAKVKFVFEYTRDTNVRDREISEQKDSKDKFIKYAEKNGIKYEESLLEKIEQIQNNMDINFFTPHESFTLESMSLRGAIGLMDHSHIEEFNINLADDYNEGLILLLGKNGSGKTTILENMHPFPQLLSKKEPLKEQFCLKNSHRILVYKTDTGKRYRISMFIDGCAKNVMTRYFCEVQEAGKSWEPIKSVDGSTSSYLQWCKATFGDVNLFLRTSFYTNKQLKSIPNLSQATKSEKMELFSILAGTDYLTTIVEQAKLLSKKEEVIISELKEQLNGYDNIEERINNCKDLIKNNTNKIKEYKCYLIKDTKELEETEKLQQDFLATASNYDFYRTQYSQTESEIFRLQKEITTSENNISGYISQLEDKELCEEQQKWLDENIKKRKELVAEQSRLNESLFKAQTYLDKKEKEFNAHKENLNKQTSELEKFLLKIDMLKEKQKPTTNKCPTCGADLSTHKKEELEKELVKIDAEIKQIEHQISKLKVDIENETLWIKENPVNNLKTELASINDKLISVVNDISAIDSYTATIDLSYIKETLTKIPKLLENETERLKELKPSLEKYKTTLANLEEKLNNIPKDYSDKITRLKRGIKDSEQQIATLSTEITFANKELSNFKESTFNALKLQIKEHQKNITEYNVIQTAFGNNGIQAIELSSAAPEIEDIANDILHKTYSENYTISFDTQRDGKNGKKIDDFIINVFDSESGRLKKLDSLSSGETTWINQALYFAFSVIRARRTGFCFKTRFLDESDGALDSTAKLQYLKMIEKTHKECNAVQTIFVTHNREIKELVDQKIEL
jgi:exonuclease SbcC